MIVSAVAAGTVRKFQSAHKMTFGYEEIDFGKGPKGEKIIPVTVGGSTVTAVDKRGKVGKTPFDGGLSEVVDVLGEVIEPHLKSGRSHQILLMLPTAITANDTIIAPPNRSDWIASARELDLKVRELNGKTLIGGLQKLAQKRFSRLVPNARIGVVLKNDLHTRVIPLLDERTQVAKAAILEKRNVNDPLDVYFLNGTGTNFTIAQAKGDTLPNFELGHAQTLKEVIENTQVLHGLLKKVYPSIPAGSLEIEQIVAAGSLRENSHGTKLANSLSDSFGETISVDFANAINAAKGSDGKGLAMQRLLQDQLLVTAAMLKHFSQYKGATPLTPFSGRESNPKGGTPVVWTSFIGPMEGVMKATVDAARGLTGEAYLTTALKNLGMVGPINTQDVVDKANSMREEGQPQLNYHPDLGLYTVTKK